MPYYGAPSKGCEACRSRKVKCDGGRPTCDRCAQYGRRCPGYRELTAVIFRDENGRIMRRATGGKRGGAGGAGSENGAAPNDDEYGPDRDQVQANKSRGGTAAFKVRGWRVSDGFNQQQSKEPSPSRPKGGDIMAFGRPTVVPVRIGANEGICFFRKEFSWEAVAMHFETLKEVTPELHSITSAFGMALLSFARRAPELRQKAYNEYGTSLQLANISLSQPDNAKSDTTLAVVILMSYFETMTGSNMQTWASHTNGAASLIALRGAEQLSNQTNYQLFLEARGMSITTSIIYKTPVPKVYFDLSRHGLELEPPLLAHGSAIFLLVSEISNLRASISASPSTLSTDKILLRVDALELRLSQWRQTCPPDFSYSTIHLPSPNSTIETHRGPVRPYTPSYTTYPSSHSINGWSLYRIGRILLGEILLNCLRPALEAGLPGTAMLATTCHAVRRVMDQMAADICGSVPYSLGLGPRKSVGEERLELGLDGGYMILMPLWVAGLVEGNGHPLRQNAQGLFDVVARRIGITHASLQIGMLEDVEGMAEWLDRLPRVEAVDEEGWGLESEQQYG